MVHSRPVTTGQEGNMRTCIPNCSKELTEAVPSALNFVGIFIGTAFFVKIETFCFLFRVEDGSNGAIWDRDREL